MAHKQFQFATWPLGIASILIVGLGIATGVGLLTLAREKRNVSHALSSPPSQGLEITQITALGRLEPKGDIIQLSAPNRDQLLKKWHIREGEMAKAGQILVVMHGLAQAQAAVENARAKVNVAQARVAQIRAGEKPQRINAQQQQVETLQAQLAGDIQVQQTIIARLQTEFEQATVDYRRFVDLFEGGGISKSELDEQRLQQEMAQQQLQEAQAELERVMATGQEKIQEARAILDSLTHIQPVDIMVAEAELMDAMSVLKQAEVDLNDLYVRSPMDGQILSINTRAGERMGNQGLATIGQTQQMYVVAEVYEGDIRHVQIGQKATIISEYGGFVGELQGQVDQIGLQISKPGIVNNDPVAQTDVRVVPVKIKLDASDSERVKKLSQLQVRVAIEI